MARKADAEEARELFGATKEVRDCTECDLIYYGEVYCPLCKEPTGEPLPDSGLIKILTDATTET